MAEQDNSLQNSLLSLLGNMQNAQQSQQSQQAPSGSEQAQNQSDILSSLLSNPEVMAKLPQIMSMLKPLMENMANTSGAQSSAPSPQSSSDSASSESAPAGRFQSGKKPADNRSALLYALRPYLGKQRQDAIDYIVKLSKLGDILKSL